jgi:hypothetical protein
MQLQVSVPPTCQAIVEVVMSLDNDDYTTVGTRTGFAIEQIEAKRAPFGLDHGGRTISGWEVDSSGMDWQPTDPHTPIEKRGGFSDDNHNGSLLSNDIDLFAPHPITFPEGIAAQAIRMDEIVHRGKREDLIRESLLIEKLEREMLEQALRDSLVVVAQTERLTKDQKGLTKEQKGEVVVLDDDEDIASKKYGLVDQLQVGLQHRATNHNPSMEISSTMRPITTRGREDEEKEEGCVVIISSSDEEEEEEAASDQHPVVVASSVSADAASSAGNATETTIASGLAVENLEKSDWEFALALQREEELASGTRAQEAGLRAPRVQVDLNKYFKNKVP